MHMGLQSKMTDVVRYGMTSMVWKRWLNLEYIWIYASYEVQGKDI